MPILYLILLTKIKDREYIYVYVFDYFNNHFCLRFLRLFFLFFLNQLLFRFHEGYFHLQNKKRGNLLIKDKRKSPQGRGMKDYIELQDIYGIWYIYICIVVLSLFL